MRQSELFGLKWENIEFAEGHMHVTRSIVYGVVGPSKTEASRKPVPIHPILSEVLLQWRNGVRYTKAEDWVFASVLVQPEMERGRSPLVSNSTLQVGICKASIWTTRLSPQHGCVPAEPASVSPGKMIVAPPCPSVPTVGAGCIRFESFVQLPFT